MKSGATILLSVGVPGSRPRRGAGGVPGSVSDELKRESRVGSWARGCLVSKVKFIMNQFKKSG